MSAQPLIGVAYLVTTVCDRRCPRCCYGLDRLDGPLGAPRHRTWAEVVADAELLRGADVLYVTGGEPTLHPDFARIVAELRVRVAPRQLVLATNGAQVVAHNELIACFDRVKLTDFADGAALAAKAWLRRHHPTRLTLESAAHRSMIGSGAGAPCGRQRIPAVAAGRVYPCCVAPGIVDAPSAPLSARWAADARALAPPCARCPFAVERAA